MSGAASHQEGRGPARVIFLCTHNKARSQIAEGILRHRGGSRVEVFSAGSDPSSTVHPQAIRVLAAMGIDASAQRSKSLAELAHERFDYVVTVCDRVREVCPIFPGSPRREHWSLPDPTAVVGSDAATAMAFEQTARQLEIRIRSLLLRLSSESEPRAS